MSIGSSSDKDILLSALKNAPHWERCLNWTKCDDLENFCGVESSNGRVSALFLTGFGLTSPIPMELLKLTHLEALVLDSNKLNGTIDSILGKFTKLQFLNISSNNFFGPLPQGAAKHIIKDEQNSIVDDERYAMQKVNRSGFVAFPGDSKQNMKTFPTYLSESSLFYCGRDCRICMCGLCVGDMCIKGCPCADCLNLCDKRYVTSIDLHSLIKCTKAAVDDDDDVSKSDILGDDKTNPPKNVFSAGFKKFWRCKKGSELVFSFKKSSSNKSDKPTAIDDEPQLPQADAPITSLSDDETTSNLEHSKSEVLIQTKTPAPLMVADTSSSKTKPTTIVNPSNFGGMAMLIGESFNPRVVNIKGRISSDSEWQIIKTVNISTVYKFKWLPLLTPLDSIGFTELSMHINSCQKECRIYRVIFGGTYDVTDKKEDIEPDVEKLQMTKLSDAIKKGFLLSTEGTKIDDKVAYWKILALNVKNISPANFRSRQKLMFKKILSLADNKIEKLGFRSFKKYYQHFDNEFGVPSLRAPLARGLSSLFAKQLEVEINAFGIITELQAIQPEFKCRCGSKMRRKCQTTHCDICRVRMKHMGFWSCRNCDWDICLDCSDKKNAGEIRDSDSEIDCDSDEESEDESSDGGSVDSGENSDSDSEEDEDSEEEVEDSEEDSQEEDEEDEEDEEENDY